MDMYRLHIARTIGLLALLVGLSVGIGPTEVLAQPDDSEEIVWIDGDGYIRVLDEAQTGGNPAVQWISPVGGWRHFAAGDFNADGDFEIVAIGGGLDDGKLTIYDPVVVTDDAESYPRINGIPWTQLYSADLVGSPTLVTAGDFDPARPGHEILYGEKIDDNAIGDPGRIFQIVILRAAGSVPDGRSWEPMFDERRYRHTWNWVFAGNLDRKGADEVILVDEDDGMLSIYKIQNGLDDAQDRILDLGSENKPWRAAVIGQFRAGDNPEVVAIRYAPLDLASFFTFQYENGIFSDDYSEIFDPSPRFVFLGDVTGSGDDEVFLLRSVPSSVTGRPHLIMRNKGDDAPNTFEVVLDADSGYRAGAAGDIDGDGKDEVVVIRDNRIRIFREPATSTDHVLYPITTNRRSVSVADLDRNGFLPMPRFSSSLMSIELTLNQGDSSRPIAVELRNTGTSESIPFTAVLNRNPSWAKLTQSAADTPADLTLTVQATDLRPGTYASEIVITSPNGNVTNQPYIIPIELTVEASLTTIPQQVIFDFFPCSDSPQSLTLPVQVEGPVGLPFSAVAVADPSTTDSVKWLTVEPDSGTVPATIALKADAELRDGQPFLRAYLRIRNEDTSGNAAEAIATVDLMCVAHQQRLPLLMR